MKLSRAYEPYLEKLLEYTHEQMGKYSVGDYCVVCGHDDPDFPEWVTSSRVYKVVDIDYGSLSTSLFSCSLSLPEFVVEDVLSGMQENIIRFTAGQLDSYVANFSVNYRTPTRLHPFAESYKVDRFGHMVDAKEQGVIVCGGYKDVSVRKMDKVAVKEYFERLIAEERKKKEAEETARAKRERERYEREKKNNSISEDELQALRSLLNKGKE